VLIKPDVWAAIHTSKHTCDITAGIAQRAMKLARSGNNKNSVSSESRRNWFANLGL
jgi:hypothetical protein